MQERKTFHHSLKDKLAKLGIIQQWSATINTGTEVQHLSLAGA